MFRRARFSVRPNVGGSGKTAAPSQEAVPASQETKEAPQDVDESVATSAVTDSKPVDAPVAKATAVSDGNDPNGAGTSSLAAVQRRKRFSAKPRVAPGRLAALPRTPKSPAKVHSKSPPINSDLEPQIETQAAPSRAQSPTLPEPEPIIPADDGSEQAAAVSADHSPNGAKKAEKASVPSEDGIIKAPSRPPNKVSLPDKEAAALSEKAQTLLSSKSRKSSIPRFSLSRLLNDPSDIQRMEKAQKLRDMLRQEMRKEKSTKRAKRKHEKECILDPSKMTMRDLIRYLPVSNPMSSSLEDGTQENETVVPFSRRKEELPERAQKLEPDVVAAAGSQAEDPVAAAEEEEDDEAQMVPRVKVAEDGTLILDEESLTVEVQRAKGPNPADDRDPIFERGSTTTYSSFRASTYCKPWTSEETDMFFLAISMVGTDFSMIGQLFHNRTRAEIRNKFKKEERQNSWRIDKAFRERRKLDILYFSKLLEKILEVQANRKKLKSLVEKNKYKKRQRSSKGAKSKEFLDDLLDSEEEEDKAEGIDGFSSSDTEDGEKENDELCKDGKALVSKARKKRKHQIVEDVSAAKLKKTESKAGEKSSEEDDACTPEDTEAALLEDQPDSQVCESTETDKSSESTSIKPAKLLRGRAAKPILPLGRKWSKKLPPGSTTVNAEDDVPPLEDDGAADEASKGQMNKETTAPRRVSEEDGDGDGGVSSGEEDYVAKPAQPTRYGRVPKPPSLLKYSAKEEVPTSKPKRNCTSKRARSASTPSAAPALKKCKLITLRASQSESSEDEEEQGQQRDDEEAFVPACLRSPSIVISQVDETMEELDILGHMSDVLDISQVALCPDSLCEGDKSEAGVPETGVHQLDLLVDVIDLLSSEQTEVSEVESYNEAAQTLLAIGNVSHCSQSVTAHYQRTESQSDSVNEANKFLEAEIAEFIKENTSSQIPFASTDDRVTQTIETPSSAPTNTDASPPRTVSGPDSSPPAQSSPQTRRGYSSKVKPKPNIARASRTAHSKSQPDASLVNSPVESCNLAPIVSKETIPLEGEFDQASEKQTCAFTQVHFATAASTDAESGQNYVAASHVAVVEPQIDESNVPLLQERGDDDTARQEILQCQKLSEVQETRSRFPKVKPKPNLLQISRRARSKPHTAEESNPSPNLESSSKTIAEVETQPAPLETPVHCTSSASTVIPIMTISCGVIPLKDLISSEEKKTGASCASGYTKSTDSKVVESARNNETTSDAAATESQARESKASLDQEGRNHDSTLRELSEFQNPIEVVSTGQTRRSRFPKVKPRPNLSQISRSALLKPQITNETSIPPNLETTCKVTAEVQPQACTSSFETPGQYTSPASTVTPIMNLSASMIQSEELTSCEKILSIGHVAGNTKSTDADVVESGRNTEAAPEPEAEVSKTLLLQEGGEFDTTIQEESKSQKPKEVLSFQQTRRSHFTRIKPNLSQASRTAQSAQTTKETSLSEVEPQPICPLSPGTRAQNTSMASNTTSNMNVSSGMIVLEELASVEENMVGAGLATGETKSQDTETVESAHTNETAEFTELETKESKKALDQEAGDCDKGLLECPKQSETVSAQQTRSRFPKVKPKTNLQTSRNAQAKLQTTKEIRLSPHLESTCKTTAEVQPEPTGQVNTSASTVTAIVNIGASVTPLEELTPSGQKMSAIGLDGRDTKSKDLEAVQSGRKNEEASVAAVTEPQAEESNKPFDQEGGDHGSTLQELPECQNLSKVVSAHQTRRSRFPVVKPKVNLLRTTRSAQAKPQTTKEMSLSPILESTCKTTAEIQPHPTGTSLKLTNQSTSSASTVMPVMNLSAGMIPSEELTASEQKMAGFGPSTGDTKSTDCETVESGHRNEATSDAAVTEPQAKKSNQPLEQKDGDHDSTLQELPKCKNLSKVVSRSRFPKVKPNILQRSRGSLSESQPTKETSTFTDLKSTCKTIAEAAARDTKSTDSDLVESGCDHEAASPTNSETCHNVPSGAMTAPVGGTNQEDSEVSNHTRETIQRRRCLPKVKPNLRFPARATQSTSQSKDGLGKPSNLTSDCRSVSASSASAQCASSDVCSIERSTLSIPEGQRCETPIVGEETASNIALHQERLTATSTSLNSTPDGPSLNITLEDSVQESSGMTEANLVTAEAQNPNCTKDTLLPKTSTVRRSRLVKPKPNVGQGARQSRQVAVKTRSDTSSSPRGQMTVLLTPVEGANGQVKATCSASMSETPASEHPVQDDLASSTGASQTSASISIFPDTLSVPTDPDEPFFILSLMEVPSDESPPQPPRADLAVQHRAVAGSGVPRGETGVTTSVVVDHLVVPAPPAGSEDTTASAVTSSPQRRPKGFLSFLTGTSSAAQSHRGKAASRRPNVSKPKPRKRPMAQTAALQPQTTQTTGEPKPLTPCTITIPSSASCSSTEVSVCHHGNSVSVQEEPTTVSQYFLSDIFTEVNDT